MNSYVVRYKRIQENPKKTQRS